jgi:hypothetical protein
MITRPGSKKILVRRRGAPFLDASNGRQCSMEHKKAGRPSKGDRKRLPVRLPTHLAEAAQKYAERTGRTFNDLVEQLLAAEVGDTLTQEGLPLSA